MNEGRPTFAIDFNLLRVTAESTGQDLYRLLATQMFAVPYSAVTDAQRQAAKQQAFATMYSR